MSYVNKTVMKVSASRPPGFVAPWQQWITTTAWTGQIILDPSEKYNIDLVKYAGPKQPPRRARRSGGLWYCILLLTYTTLPY